MTKLTKAKFEEKHPKLYKTYSSKYVAEDVSDIMAHSYWDVLDFMYEEGVKAGVAKAYTGAENLTPVYAQNLWPIKLVRDCDDVIDPGARCRTIAEWVHEQLAHRMASELLKHNLIKFKDEEVDDYIKYSAQIILYTPKEALALEAPDDAPKLHSEDIVHRYL